MKKLLSGILIVIYSAMSFGMTLTTHYCMGKTPDTECGTADTAHSCVQPEKSAQCCSTETRFIKLTLDQKDVQLSAIGFDSGKELLQSDTWKNPFIHNTLKGDGFFTYHETSLQKGNTPLYLFHCLLLI